jgi:hypothetical protein
MGAPNIETVLVAKRYDILESFVARVRGVELVKPTVSAADLARPLAGWLTWMARSLAGLRTEPMESTRLAYDYADDRRRLGYELPSILTELGLIRATLVHVATSNGLRDAAEVERASALLHRLHTDAVIRATSKVSSTTLRVTPAFR